MTDIRALQTLNGGKMPPARFCFICGYTMKESWRSSEQGGHYVWYECSRPGCDQNYLIRESPEASPLFNELICKA